MTGIVWSDDLALGAAEVDVQHRVLVDVLSDANVTFQTGDVRGAVLLLRRFLAEFAAHFADEQRRLTELGCDTVTEREREYSTSHFIFAAHPLEADDVEVIGQLLNYANAWLLDHIVRQDSPVRGLLAPPATMERRRFRFDVIKLRWRIAALGLVPLLVLTGLVVVSGVELERNAAAMRLMSRMNHMNAHISDLMHELQHERGLATLVYYDRRLGRDKLQDQYRATDAAMRSFRDLATELETDLPAGAAARKLDGALHSLDLIKEVRDDVDTGSFDAVENMDFYTTAIEDLALLVPEVVRTFLPSDFAKLTFAQVFLQQVKERAGHERAAGVAILSSGAPGRPIVSVRDLAAEQRALATGFMALAPADLAAAYRAAERLNEGPMTWMRNALETGELTYLSAQEWFEVTSHRIDAMRDVESMLTERLDAEADNLDRTTNQRYLVMVSGMAVLMLMSLVMVLSLGWSILPPLARLAAAVRRLANGERAVSIPGLASRDELGGVARFVEQLKERLVHSDLLDARRLTANAERLRVVADNTPGIVFRVFQAETGSSVVVCASRKARDILGLSPADIVDIPVRRLLRRMVAPSDWGGLLHMMRRQEPSSMSFEFQIRHDRPGAPRWLRVVVSPTPTEGGWLWDGVALDVSGLKAAERERHRIAGEAGRLGAAAPQPVPTARGVAIQVSLGLRPLSQHAEQALRNLPPDAPGFEDIQAILADVRRLERVVSELTVPALADDRDGPREASATVIPFKGKT